MKEEAREREKEREERNKKKQRESLFFFLVPLKRPSFSAAAWGRRERERERFEAPHRRRERERERDLVNQEKKKAIPFLKKNVFFSVSGLDVSSLFSLSCHRTQLSLCCVFLLSLESRT